LCILISLFLIYKDWNKNKQLHINDPNKKENSAFVYRFFFYSFISLAVAYIAGFLTELSATSDMPEEKIYVLHYTM